LGDEYLGPRKDPLDRGRIPEEKRIYEGGVEQTIRVSSIVIRRDLLTPGAKGFNTHSSRNDYCAIGCRISRPRNSQTYFHDLVKEREPGLLESVRTEARKRRIEVVMNMIDQLYQFYDPGSAML